MSGTPEAEVIVRRLAAFMDWLEDDVCCVFCGAFMDRLGEGTHNESCLYVNAIAWVASADEDSARAAFRTDDYAAATLAYLRDALEALAGRLEISPLADYGPKPNGVLLDDIMQALPECDGACIDSGDVGVPGFGVAYVHPGCPKHDDRLGGPVDLERVLADIEVGWSRLVNARVDAGGAAEGDNVTWPEFAAEALRSIAANHDGVLRIRSEER